MTYEELRNLNNPRSKKYKNAVKKWNEETDQLYDYYKREMSHLAGSVRTISDKYGCLDRLFRSMQGVMENWFMKYTKMDPYLARQVNIDDLKNNKELDKNPKVKEMLITYTKVCQQKRNGKVDDPADLYELDADGTITDKQREGLKTFQQWLQKHCDTAGIRLAGFGSKGPVRNFTEEFMKLPARVQLKALYLLETGKRKNPRETADNRDSQKDSYVPDMNKIRKTMVASKFKFFKRFNGSQFYWNKLQDAVEIAKGSEASLKAYTDVMKATRWPSETWSDEATERIRKKVFPPQPGETEEEIKKQSARTEKFSVGVGNEVEAIAGYGGNMETYREIADGVYAAHKGNVEASVNESAGKGFSVAGGVAAAVATVATIAELKSKWSLLKKKDVFGKVAEIGSSLSDTGYFSMDILRNVIGVGGKVLDVVGSGFCAASGAALVVKNSVDLYSEKKNTDKVKKIQENLEALKKELEQERKKIQEDKEKFQEKKNTYSQKIQQEQEKKLHDRQNAYEANMENIKKIEKIAKLSLSDSARNKTRGKYGMFGSSILAGCGTLGFLSALNVIAPLTGPIGVAVSGSSAVAMGVIQSVVDDKARVSQNREYIDSDMYQSEVDREDVRKAAIKNLKDGQSLFEKDSTEWKKMEKMIQEAENNTDKFQDKIRDLYVAKKGYIHQTAGTEGIKDKFFGEVYDQVYKKKESELKDPIERKIHTNFQDLLRSEGIQVRHTEERREKKGASKEKVLDQIKER